jgi:hypothetical protein
MICWFHNHGNIIRYNKEIMFLINSYQGAGFHVREGNSFKRSIGLFVARALIQPSSSVWIHDPNPYLVPNTISNK